MTDVREVTCRPLRTRALWIFAALGAAGVTLVAVRRVYEGPDAWLGLALPLSLVAILSLRAVTARVSADAYGLRSRTLLRHRNVPWSDVADLRVRLKYANTPRVQDTRRVILVLRDGRKRLLPLPQSWSPDDPDFDATVGALRALRRRHGVPESSHLPVVSYRTAGSGWAGSLALCALLLACAGLVAWWAPSLGSDERAWKSATPCTAGTPVAEREEGECLTTLPAVIARTDANRPAKKPSWLYFADRRPLERLAVPYEDAEEFRPGDRVELTIWRREVREVAGERHVWRKHLPAARDAVIGAAVLALAAGHPGARVLLRLRGRRLPDDEVLPSVLPFTAALVGTALWLLPLCYLSPTTPLASPVTITWAAAGSLATLGLLTWAWRATRVRPPEEAAAVEDSAEPEGQAEQRGEVFLAAGFLEHTDYNPYRFGTHIVLGGGPPAVTPHPGPGRFAAKQIPLERITVNGVRRVRGSDGDTVPRSWHIAELDDAGTPVRLAAAPADLTRIIRELSPGKTPAHTANQES